MTEHSKMSKGRRRMKGSRLEHHHKNMLQNLHGISNYEMLTDLTFYCRNNVHVHAHTDVLCQVSPLITKLASPTNERSHFVVSDWTSSTLQELLSIVYLGRSNSMVSADLDDLHSLCHSLEINFSPNSISMSQMGQVFKQFPFGSSIIPSKAIKKVQTSVYCLCKEEERPGMIGCDFCDEWYHPECLDLSERDIHDAVATVQWKCPNCEFKQLKEKKKKKTIGGDVIDKEKALRREVVVVNCGDTTRGKKKRVPEVCKTNFTILEYEEESAPKVTNFEKELNEIAGEEVVDLTEDSVPNTETKDQPTVPEDTGVNKEETVNKLGSKGLQDVSGEVRQATKSNGTFKEVPEVTEMVEEIIEEESVESVGTENYEDAHEEFELSEGEGTLNEQLNKEISTEGCKSQESVNVDRDSLVDGPGNEMSDQGFFDEPISVKVKEKSGEIPEKQSTDPGELRAKQKMENGLEDLSEVQSIVTGDEGPSKQTVAEVESKTQEHVLKEPTNETKSDATFTETPKDTEVMEEEMESLEDVSEEVQHGAKSDDAVEEIVLEDEDLQSVEIEETESYEGVLKEPSHGTESDVAPKENTKDVESLEDITEANGMGSNEDVLIETKKDGIVEKIPKVTDTAEEMTENEPELTENEVVKSHEDEVQHGAKSDDAVKEIVLEDKELQSVEIKGTENHEDVLEEPLHGTKNDVASKENTKDVESLEDITEEANGMESNEDVPLETEKDVTVEKIPKDTDTAEEMTENEPKLTENEVIKTYEGVSDELPNRFKTSISCEEIPKDLEEVEEMAEEKEQSVETKDIESYEDVQTSPSKEAADELGDEANGKVPEDYGSETGKDIVKDGPVGEKLDQEVSVEMDSVNGKENSKDIFEASSQDAGVNQGIESGQEDEPEEQSIVSKDGENVDEMQSKIPKYVDTDVCDKKQNEKENWKELKVMVKNIEKYKLKKWEKMDDVSWTCSLKKLKNRPGRKPKELPDQPVRTSKRSRNSLTEIQAEEKSEQSTQRGKRKRQESVKLKEAKLDQPMINEPRPRGRKRTRSVENENAEVEDRAPKRKKPSKVEPVKKNDRDKLFICFKCKSIFLTKSSYDDHSESRRCD